MFMRTLILVVWSFVASGGVWGAVPRELRVGRAFHAFEHLGSIGEQAETAAATGVTVIYATGLGGVGYGGLPKEAELDALRKATRDYNAKARRGGIRIILGYLCATSVVKLDGFDAHWPEEFRSRFKTRPAEWRQQGRDGGTLGSWYGGDYEPACMNHPDWREYEKLMVKMQLKTGHDGIFFDNPTVHPKGCYCGHCMEKFAGYLRRAGIRVADGSLEGVRRLVDEHPAEFLRFRSTIARDFLAEMRRHARAIRAGAWVTCNNSLNAPGVLFSQSRTYGYNIHELSKTEDWVVVEDMSHQPRRLAGGGVMEYGATYRQLEALSHGKPLVAVTIAEGDYHTPSNLVRLAMAEAAAHEASYLAWTTWPVEQRARMISAIRPQADFLRRNERFLNDTQARADVILYLPFQRWVETNRCVVSEMAAVLTRRNIQYRVVAEDELAMVLEGERRIKPVLLVESAGVLDGKAEGAASLFAAGGGKIVYADGADWMEVLGRELGEGSVGLEGSSAARVIVRDQKGRCVVHLYNLAVERLNSFADQVHPIEGISLRVRVPFETVASVTALTADGTATSGKLPFEVERVGGGSMVQFRIPRLEVSTILVVRGR